MKSPVLLVAGIILAAALKLSAQNPVPVAVNDTVTLTPMIPVTIPLLANDTIPPGDSIQFYFTGGSGGLPVTLTKNPDKTLTLLLEHWGFPGIFARGYVIRDFTTNIVSNTAWIIIRVRDKSVDWLDINNVRAMFNASGLHFFRMGSDSLCYEVPKGSGKHPIFCNAFWVGGNDSAGQLHLAAERYRQGTGNPSGVKHDYWAGPYSATGQYSPQQDTLWNYIWKISREEIEYHRIHFWEPGYKVPHDILTWPAHGNVALGQSFRLAPFSDRNGNGIYDPLDGDYPEIRGDQALFFIFNDDRGYHSETTGEKLGAEIHGMAYAYDRPGDTAFKNTTFLHYKVINRSQNTYTDTWFGSFTDIDLGYANDDYLGCDPERGMFYGYNGKPVDGTGQSFAYGANPPMQAVVILGGPKMDADGYDNPAFRGPGLAGPSFHGDCSMVGLDSNVVNMKYGPGEVYEAPFMVRSAAVNGLKFGDGTADNERYGMRRFVYHNNSNAGVPSYGLPYPLYASEYYQVMLGFLHDGTKMIYGGNGHPNAGGYGPVCDFMFPGLSDTCNWGTAGLSPNGPKEWTEKTALNQPQDRRGYASSGPFTFRPGDVQEFDLAFVWARDYTPQDSTSALRKLNTAVDTVRRCFAENRLPGGGVMYGVGEEIDRAGKRLRVWPNPATGEVFFETPEETGGMMKATLLTLAGNKARSGLTLSGRAGRLDLDGIAPGFYILRVQAREGIWTGRVLVAR